MNRLRRLRDTLFPVDRYGPTDRDRARAVYTISALMLLGITALVLIALAAPNTPELLGIFASPPLLVATMALLYISLGAAIVLVRQGRLRWGAVIVIALWALTMLAPIALSNLRNLFHGQLIAITVLLLALLLRQTGLLLGVITAAVTVFVVYADSPDQLGLILPSNLISIGITAGLTYALLRLSSLSREEGLDQALAERLKLAELTAEIARRISSRSALADVLSQTVEDIVANYPDIYHAQIFLVDSVGLHAQLAASTGPVGSELLARGHSLEVGSRSVIGQVTGQGRVVVARAGEQDATVHRHNEHLPETRVEAAFPLRSGGRVIGALDLQSKLDDAFPERNLPVFQTLADQIAIAIDNARLFEEAQRSLAENRALLAQNERALRDVERYAARLAGQAWRQFLDRQPSAAGLSLDLARGTASDRDAWLPVLERALESGQVEQARDNGHLQVAVPLRVRGVALGAMAFQVPGLEALAPEDLALAQTVGDRLGLALENARLFDESQRAAQRQALINEISAQLQTSANVEATLRAAAHSLHDALGAGRVTIRLGQPPGAETRAEIRKDGSA
ncbi:MAG: GAF domain-containing protein [Aggregatilineales bacterium]